MLFFLLLLFFSGLVRFLTLHLMRKETPKRSLIVFVDLIAVGKTPAKEWKIRYSICPLAWASRNPLNEYKLYSCKTPRQ